MEVAVDSLIDVDEVVRLRVAHVDTLVHVVELLAVKGNAVADVDGLAEMVLARGLAALDEQLQEALDALRLRAVADGVLQVERAGTAAHAVDVVDGIREAQQPVAQPLLMDELVEAEETSRADVCEDAAWHDGLVDFLSQAPQQLAAKRLAVRARGRLEGWHIEVDGREILALLQVIVHELDARHEHAAAIGVARLLVDDGVAVIVEVVAELPEAADDPLHLSRAIEWEAIGIDGARAALRDALAEVPVLRPAVLKQLLSCLPDGWVDDVQAELVVCPADDVGFIVEAEEVEERLVGTEEALLAVLPENTGLVVGDEAAPEQRVALHLRRQVRCRKETVGIGHRLDAIPRSRLCLDDERLDADEVFPRIAQVERCRIEAHPGVAAVRLADAEAVREGHLPALEQRRADGVHVDVGEEASPVGRIDHLLGIGGKEAADAAATRCIAAGPSVRADEHFARVLLRMQEKDMLVEQAKVAHNLVEALLFGIVGPLHRDIIELRLVDGEFFVLPELAHRDAQVLFRLGKGHGLLTPRQLHLLHEVQEAHAERMVRHAQAAVDLFLVADARP